MPPGKVIGFYGHFYNDSISSIDFENITHIYDRFLKVDSAKLLVYVTKDHNPDTLINLVHQKSKNIFVSIAGNACTYIYIARDPRRRAKFADTVAKFCNKYKYDGVDINWETPAASDSAIFTQFIRTIYDSLKTKINSPQLSIDLPGQFCKVNKLQYAELKKNICWINLMTYGYGNCDTTICQHNAPLSKIKTDVDSFLSRMPGNKLVLGLPFYGIKYTKFNDSIKLNVKIDKKSDCIGYREIQNHDSTWGTPIFDLVDSVPYKIKRGVHELLSYDDSTSIDYKCKFIKRKQLAGAMYWAIDYDLPVGKKSLVKVIANELRDKK